jgi:hypothetical protein
LTNLIVKFYRAIQNKSNLVGVPLVGSLQHCFQQP